MFSASITSTMTLFNIYQNANDDPEMQKVVIDGVFWVSNYKEQLANKGIEIGDKVQVFVLQSTVIDGKTYLPSFEFSKQTDKSNYWTLSKDDVIVNASVTDDVSSVAQLEKMFGVDNVLNISSIINNNFGSETMRHWEILAR